MKCPNCGNEYEGKFCDQCGYSAAGPAQPTPIPPAQTPIYPAQQPVYSQPPIIPQQSPKKKNLGCLIGGVIVAVVLVIAAVIIAVAISVTNKTIKSTPSNQNSVSQSQAAAYSQQPSQNKLLYDKGGVKIYFKILDMSANTRSAKVKLLIENNTSKSIMVQARDFSVNGYMINPIMSTQVEPGKKANADITILKTYLDENDIKDIKNIELSFIIVDPADMRTQTKSDKIKLIF